MIAYRPEPVDTRRFFLHGWLALVAVEAAVVLAGTGFVSATAGFAAAWPWALKVSA